MKGLEALKEIKNQLIRVTDFAIAHNDSIRAKYCLNTEEDIERYVDNVIGVKIIEKELKALEIIKSKEINIHALLLHLKRFDSPFGYNTLVGDKYKLTQEEYDLLKEVL